MKTLEKKYQSEEEIVLIQNTEEKFGNLENESLNKLTTLIENASWEEKEARREL